MLLLEQLVPIWDLADAAHEVKQLAPVWPSKHRHTPLRNVATEREKKSERERLVCERCSAWRDGKERYRIR